ncbi:hypothetical protein BDV25DRAFT_169138 [Aspergillus avenaceus]|uniref:Short-chain dehydrogenase/reductase family protein n=1 Tax=Aspergillus avenaceus TaxID=36643 RepID=A0A5N6U3V0_ASPAV|nr:hypothetical protein BDV25DRAFT_169138 [Aspergillus avenaceus]
MQKIHTTLSLPQQTQHPHNLHQEQSQPEQGQPEQSNLTLDTVVSVLSKTIFHPWPSWILVLSLRAQVTPPSHPAFLLAISWAILLTLVAVAKAVNARFAYGLSRRVEMSDEVVVVTGGASGLGLLIARIYLMRGVGVAVVDVRGRSEREVVELVEGGVEYFEGDVADLSVLEECVREVGEKLGTPTILINCAAARINGHSILNLSADAFQRTIQTNLLAVFRTCQVFLPCMLAAPNGGTIVNVSSVLGQLCPAGLADYSVSKAGLSALHRTLEAELRATGDDDKVKMLLVEPGQVATPLFASVKTPNRFIAPVLEPVCVAREIVSAIEEGRAGVIRLPAYATLVNWYAVLPASLQRIARYLSGIDQAVVQSPTQSESKPMTTE